MNKRQRIAQVVLNILIIAELCTSIYLANRNPEFFTVIFFKYLFIMIIPTLILGIFALRILRTKETRPEIPSHVIEKERLKKEKAKESAQVIGLKKPAYISHKIPKMMTGEYTKLSQISKWRSFFQKTASLSLIIVALSFLDSCQAKFRQPINVLNVLPGTTKTISGTLNEQAKDVKDLTYISSSDLIQLVITDMYSGFWFGNPGWNGLLKISPDIKPGQYTLKVVPKRNVSQKQPFVFYITVHQDSMSLRKTFKSMIMRSSGFSPWRVIAFLFPLTILSFGTVYLLSRKIESLMEKGGNAEVFWIRAGNVGYEIAFGLGTRQGVKLGDHLSLFNEKGEPVGTVEVQKVSKTNSVAIAGFDCPVKIGYIVSINKY